MSIPATIIRPSTQPKIAIGITLVHGLLTRDDGSWSDHLMRWGNTNSYADFSMLKYWEGVLGWGHQQHVRELIDLLHVECEQWKATGQQHIIGHSNGCRLTLEALVQDSTLVLDDLHLIAAWAPRDCRRHINIILARQQARRIFLYVSKNDDTLGWNKYWPFYFTFTLGRDGPEHASPLPIEKPFMDLSPGLTWPLAIGRNDLHDHCSWVDGAAGFNDVTFGKMLELSAPVS